MGFYIRGAPPPRPHTGQLLIHERMPPTRSGQGAGSGSGSEGETLCLGVAIVAVTGTNPSPPRGVHVCQLSSGQTIMLPSPRVRVCLTFARFHQFVSVPFGKVAHLGSDPYGLTGCEVGCLVVDCHGFGVVWFGLIVARNGGGVRQQSEPVRPVDHKP